MFSKNIEPSPVRKQGKKSCAKRLHRDENSLKIAALWMFCDTRSFNDYRAPSRPRGFNNKGVVDEYRRPKMAWNAIGRLLKKTF